jgi:hypothetical protein
MNFERERERGRERERKRGGLVSLTMKGYFVKLFGGW